MTPPNDRAPANAGTGAHVFVSYARANEKQARPLVEAIEAAGYVVWWDALIHGGEAFSGSIATALNSAFAVVVLWSKEAVDSHWVRDEAQIGADRGRLVPVTLDGTPPPLGFRQFHTIDLARDRSAARLQLVDAIAALADRGSLVALPQAGGPPRRRALSRRAVLAATGGAIVGAGLLGQSYVRRYLFPVDDDGSIAVLPFDDLSGDPGKAYFAAGVAAEIRAQLTRIPSMQVAAQASSVAVAQANLDARTTAGRLRVAYLLDGNVRREGNRLRIWTELVDGRSGFTKWSHSFDRPASDLFAVQAEIAGAVSTAIGSRIMGKATAGSGATEPGGTANLAAFDAFLRGKHLFNTGTGEATDRAALAEFDQAIALDPAYALAHAARGRALVIIANQYAQGETRRATYVAAIAAAERAVQLAPTNASAQSALGFALFDGRLSARAADQHYELARKYGAGDADVLSRYGLFSTRMGRFDRARAALARASILDPLNARVPWSSAEVELADRRYGTALTLAAEALRLNPKMSVVRSLSGTALYLSGKIDQAAAAYDAEPSSLFRLTGLAIVRHRQGRASDAAQLLTELVETHGDNSLYQQAQIMAQQNRLAEAESLLAKAWTAGDAGLTLLRNDALLDPVRTTGTFTKLMIEMGFA